MEDAAADRHLNLSEGRAHAVAAANDACQIFGAVGGKQRFDLLPAQAKVDAPAHQRGKGAIGLQDRARAVERDYPGWNGFNDGLQFAAALFDSQVSGGQLRGRSLSQLAAGVQVSGHAIEGSHQLTHLAGSRQRHPMVVFAGGDFGHRHGQSLDRTGDLIGEKPRHPYAEEERKHGNYQQDQDEYSANLIALVEELPISGRAGTDAHGRLAESLRHGQRHYYEFA